MSEALVLRDYGRLTFAITTEAIRIKEAALEQSALIAAVTTPEQNEAAAFAQREIKRTLKLFEDARKAVKQPIIEYGRLIDQTTKTAVKELEMEEIRLATEIGNFQQAELEKVRAEQRRIADEQVRIERERQAELARIAEEARKAEAQAASEHERAEIAKRAEAEKLKAEQAAQFSQECIKPSDAVASKAAGQVVRTDWEIVRINDFQLMKARPDLVRKIEFDLRQIKDELRRGVKLPGVEAREVVQASVRLGADKKEIEV